MPRTRATFLGVLVGLIIAAAMTATALAGTAPTLGLKTANATWAAGFGAVRPAAINFNGDPTSFIDKIHWNSWGGTQAVGHGIAGFTWPGFAVADGTRYVTATVVAFDLGRCDGHPAYQREEWYFPQYGETFSAASAVFDICSRFVPRHKTGVLFPDPLCGRRCRGSVMTGAIGRVAAFSGT